MIVPRSDSSSAMSVALQRTMHTRRARTEGAALAFGDRFRVSGGRALSTSRRSEVSPESRAPSGTATSQRVRGNIGAAPRREEASSFALSRLIDSPERCTIRT